MRERELAALRCAEPSRGNMDELLGAGVGAESAAEDDREKVEKGQRQARTASAVAAPAPAPSSPSSHPPHSARFAPPREEPPAEATARPVDPRPPPEVEQEMAVVAANAARVMDTAPLADSHTISLTAEEIVVPHTC